jgi:hypothetical protein
MPQSDANVVPECAGGALAALFGRSAHLPAALRMFAGVAGRLNLRSMRQICARVTGSRVTGYRRPHVAFHAAIDPPDGPRPQAEMKISAWRFAA